MLILQAEGVGRAARASIQAQQLISDELIPIMLSSPTAPPQTTPLDGGPSSITDPVPRHEASSLVPPLKANAQYKTASGQSVTHDEDKQSSPDYSTAMSSIHPTIPSPSPSSSSSSDSYLKSELGIGQNYDPSPSTPNRLLNKLLIPSLMSPVQRVRVDIAATAASAISYPYNQARKGITATTTTTTTTPTVPPTASAKKTTSRRTSKKKGEKEEVSVTITGNLEDEIDSISARLRQRLSSTSIGAPL